MYIYAPCARETHAYVLHLSYSQDVAYDRKINKKNENHQKELKMLKNTRIILALGKIAFDGCIKFLKHINYLNQLTKLKFSHGAFYKINKKISNPVKLFILKLKRHDFGLLTLKTFIW